MYLIWGLLSYWKFFTIIGLSAVIGWAMWSSKNKDQEIFELQHDIQQKVFYVESLEDAIDIQNELITDMEDRVDTFEERLKESKKRNEYIKSREKKRIQEIRNTQIGSECEDSMDFLLQQAQDEFKWAD